MSSDGGDDFTQVFRDNPLKGLADAFTQYVTFGLAGVGEDGKLKKGVTGRAVDEGVGELTGRNAQREQMNAAKDRLKIETENRRVQQANEQMRNQQVDQSKSNTAAAAYATSTALSRESISQTAETMTSRDFLGL